MPVITRTLALLLAIALPWQAVAADAPKVALDTSLGTIVIELDEEHAPLSSANFLSYVDAGYYTGTLFHRVIPNFMIQGGGFDEQHKRKATEKPIRNEANNGLKNRRGTLAMARTSDPHSATAQFFINTVDNRSLDHTSESTRGWGYAVFGRVVEGMDVVDAISATPTGTAALGGYPARDVPTVPVIIKSATRVSATPEQGAAGE